MSNHTDNIEAHWENESEEFKDWVFASLEWLHSDYVELMNEVFCKLTGREVA